MTATDADPLVDERARIKAEYRRRARDVDESRYALWQAAPSLQHASRVREAADLLHRAGLDPRPGAAVLEIGCGSLGWLADFLAMGARESDLRGIDLDEDRVAVARAAFPSADLRLGDAAHLPWPDGSCSVVVASTIFSSILSDAMRAAVAAEIVRVLAPGGALLWYDFAWNNPRNRSVRGVGVRELRSLFPSLRGETRSITLAPPLARFVAPKSWTLAAVLEAVPFLRTHLIAALVKQ